MDIDLLQPAEVEFVDLTSASSDILPDLVTATNTDDRQPESTIAPYYTGLNGVEAGANMVCRDILWGSLGLVVVVILLLRLGEMIWNQKRQTSVVSEPAGDQASWKSPRTYWTAKVKRHLIYASFWRKRHHREYRIFSLNFGTLPSRLQFIFIVFLVGSNIAYLAALKRGNPNSYVIYAELRGRSATLVVANLVPLIILAGRNNPLIPILKISFDTYNLFHRWLGRIAIVEIIIHVACWLIPVVADGGWALVGRKISGDLFLASGLTGALCMLLILVLSLSPLRHAHYETFLNIHIFLACTTFACCWIHCAAATNVGGNLPELPWIMAVVYLWIGERVLRAVRTIYINWSGRKAATTAFCQALPGEVTLVTLDLPKYIRIKPGTHAYLRFYWAANSWESHPFSIAWVNHVEKSHIPTSRVTTGPSRMHRANATTTASFLITAHKGITRRLFDRAKAAPGGIHLKASMEGPYAGYQSFDSYGHVVLIAGAGGITHQVSYLRHLLESFNAGSAATRRLTLIWAIRDYNCLSWIHPHLEELRQIPHSEDMLRVKVFVTKPQEGVGAYDTSPIVEVFAGRPNMPSLLEQEIENQVGAMCVSVCGPGALTDDVRDAVRAVQGASIVDFIEESFTW